MYKKVKFEVKFRSEDDEPVINTALTKGYPHLDVVERIRTSCDEITIAFAVNRMDLQDLRNDVEILVKAGYNVREVQP